MRELLTVLLVMLAVHRITRLVIADRIARAPREWLQNYFERQWTRRPGDIEAQRQRREVVMNSDEWQSAGAYWFSCPWCVSIWVGAVVVVAASLTVGVTAPVLVWLAASTVTGLLWKE